MKICFLIPPTKGRNPDRLFGCNYAFFMQHNIFILYPASLLKQYGFDVKFIDCTKEKKSLNDVLKRDFDVYVFYSVFLTRKTDLSTAEKIEKKFKNKAVVFLGTDPTYSPEKYATKKNRFVVRGEPEYILLELVKALKNKKKNFLKIKGLTWYNSKLINNKSRDYIKNLDNLPFPDRTLIKRPFSYFNPKFKKQPSTTMLTSRGCSFRCYFCIPNSLSFAREIEWKRHYGKKPPVSMRSPKNIIEEFKLLKEQGYKSVFIVDDEFIWGKERTIKILKGIRNLGMEISILARCDMLTDEELVKELAKSNVKYVDLGVESFSQEILDDVKKDLDVRTIRKSIRNLKKYRIEPEVNIVFGTSPLETKGTIKNTIKQVKKLDVDFIHATTCTPFPGTDFREIAIKKGWTVTGDKDYIPIDPGADSLIEYPHLSRKELVKAVKKIYRQHYFNLRYLFKQFLRTRSLKELKNKIKTGESIFKNILLNKNEKKKIS